MGVVTRWAFLCAIASAASAESLPARYFPLLEAGTSQVEAKLSAEPQATLAYGATPLSMIEY